MQDRVRYPWIDFGCPASHPLPVTLLSSAGDGDADAEAVLRSLDPTQSLRRSPRVRHERASRAKRCRAPPMRSASQGPDRILARGSRGPAPPADGAEAVAPGDERGTLRRPRPVRSATRGVALARVRVRLNAPVACHYPTGDKGAECGKRVVTGGKSGLRASGGKGIAKNAAREAFVTAWYGAAIHRAATGSVVG